MAKASSAAPIRVIEETPAYWRVVFDYPPFNILDATIFGGLQDLLVRMDVSQGLRVVVFESAIPDFYLAHFDLTGKTGSITTAVGPSGLPIQDRDGGVLVMATLFGMFPFLKTLFVDSGYQGPKFAKGVAKVLPHLSIEIVKRSDQVSGFLVLPKRWILDARTISTG